jgi:Cu+-exporting ATPase
MSNTVEVKEKISCHHCGDDCVGKHPVVEDHHFCCEGCKTVYYLLLNNGLSQYYNLNQLPGISKKKSETKDYSFLNEVEIKENIIRSSIDGIASVQFELPSIHCSSCIWLLENLYKINQGIKSVQVNFLRKEATIRFYENDFSLPELASLLDFIGYAPAFNLATAEEKTNTPSINKSQWLKIGVAGFCFGNIMLLSFPDYLGSVQADIAKYFRWLLVLFAIPVMLYSGREFLVSAWKKLRIFSLGVDVPIALGMVTLFTRSLYEIIAGTGVGYLDSLSGFVFFLLIGRSFQDYTLQTISFERDFKSYFPISTLVQKGKSWISTSLKNLNKDQIILVKNQEIIPCDSILLSASSKIDYSFVTGESNMISAKKGDMIFAGGRHFGTAIKLKVQKKVAHSYLTSLWNQDHYEKSADKPFGIIDSIGTYFTLIILAIALATFVFWYINNPSFAFSATTAVLIIACPCVIALSVPFIYGNALRILPKYGIYVKDIAALVTLERILNVVFDKTGTITDNTHRKVIYKGKELSTQEKIFIKTLALHSGHPLSQSIVENISEYIEDDLDEFNEFPGLGIEGMVQNNRLRLGSSEFILDSKVVSDTQEVLIEYNGEYLGKFEFDNQIRPGIEKAISNWNQDVGIQLLSGDSAREDQKMKILFPKKSQRNYNQKPIDKLNFVKKLQRSGPVMMIGDGLNDAGALRQSDVGMVIADQQNNFSPACDIILAADQITNLAGLFRYGKLLKKALIGAFGLAFLYNTIGLFFAVQGLLSPVVAAILMPISSISVILYGVSISSLSAKSIFKRED